MDRRMSSVTKIVGIIILSMGILLAAWIFHTIYQLIQGEGKSSIVTRILDIGAIDKTITISSETIILPESFFYILGVLILVQNYQQPLKVTSYKAYYLQSLFLKLQQ